jgi:hypothetical protein
MSDRWEPFTKTETMLIHRALRMLTTHPLTGPDDLQAARRLADEIWDRHAAQVAEEMAL